MSFSKTNLLKAITKQQMYIPRPAIQSAIAGSAALYVPHHTVSRTTKTEMRVLLLDNSQAKAICDTMTTRIREFSLNYSRRGVRCDTTATLQHTTLPSN